MIDQGSKGIRQCPINYCTSPMITQNCRLSRIQLVVETFEQSTKLTTNRNSIKVPKVVRPTNKETLL